MSTEDRIKRDRDDRLSVVAERPLDSSSLVGSFFLGNAQRGWQGCVVAEPSPGIYLVELFGWLVGDSTDQQLVPIAEMSDWTFYDDAGWMRNAYEHGGVRTRWERERENTST